MTIVTMENNNKTYKPTAKELSQFYRDTELLVAFYEGRTALVDGEVVITAPKRNRRTK